jgi:hypothetical protein
MKGICVFALCALLLLAGCGSSSSSTKHYNVYFTVSATNFDTSGDSFSFKYCTNGTCGNEIFGYNGTAWYGATWQSSTVSLISGNNVAITGNFNDPYQCLVTHTATVNIMVNSSSVASQVVECGSSFSKAYTLP